MRNSNMSVKLNDFLDIDDIDFEENSVFKELVKVSIVEENHNNNELVLQHDEQRSQILGGVVDEQNETTGVTE